MSRIRSRICKSTATLLAGAMFLVSTHASTVETPAPLEVWELILTDKSVLEYLHLDLPERTPVQISSMFLHPDLSSRRLGYPMEIVPATSQEATSAFQLTRVDVAVDMIVVELLYPIEGLKGRFTFSRQDDNWVVRKRKFWEQ